jgi:hypothetical protein
LSCGCTFVIRTFAGCRVPQVSLLRHGKATNPPLSFGAATTPGAPPSPRSLRLGWESTPLAGCWVPPVSRLRPGKATTPLSPSGSARNPSLKGHGFNRAAPHPTHPKKQPTRRSRSHPTPSQPKLGAPGLASETGESNESALVFRLSRQPIFERARFQPCRPTPHSPKKSTHATKSRSPGGNIGKYKPTLRD